MKQISKAYAEAIFSIALEQKKVTEFAEKLEQLEALLTKHPDYCSYLKTPALPLHERLTAIEEAFGNSMPEEIVSYLKLLCENGHITILPDSIKEFFKLEMAVSNTVTATVTSAIALTDAQKEKLIQKLEAKYHKHLCPIYKTDSSLIGGLRIELEDNVLDGTIVKGLQSLKEVIKT